jgi:hypothetical protein
LEEEFGSFVLVFFKFETAQAAGEFFFVTSTKVTPPLKGIAAIFEPSWIPETFRVFLSKSSLLFSSSDETDKFPKVDIQSHLCNSSSTLDPLGTL